MAGYVFDIEPEQGGTLAQIQRTARREVGEELAGSDQGGPKLTFQLWQLSLIVDAPA